MVTHPPNNPSISNKPIDPVVSSYVSWKVSGHFAEFLQVGSLLLPPNPRTRDADMQGDECDPTVR